LKAEKVAVSKIREMSPRWFFCHLWPHALTCQLLLQGELAMESPWLQHSRLVLRECKWGREWFLLLNHQCTIIGNKRFSMVLKLTLFFSTDIQSLVCERYERNAQVH